MATVIKLSNANFTQEQHDYFQHQYGSGDSVLVGFVKGDNSNSENEARTIAANAAREANVKNFVVRVAHAWAGQQTENGEFFWASSYRVLDKTIEDEMEEGIEYPMIDDEVQGWIPVK